MHLAAQYLATAAISFINAKEDDSHTNMGFDPESGHMYSRSFGMDSYFLSLSYVDFSLNFHNQARLTKYDLNGKSHKDIVSWINQRCSELNITPEYKYDLHYELPYPIDDEFIFELIDQGEMAYLLEIRRLSFHVFSNFIKDNNLNSEIRIWPHHFDTGVFFTPDKVKSINIGMGLAIPDDLINDHYYYASGYDENGPISTLNFKPLHQGKWIDNGFKGAVLPAKNMDYSTIVDFLKQAKGAYL